MINPRVSHRRYDALLKAYEQLAELVIHTIRVEIRCRIVHFLNLAMRQVRLATYMQQCLRFLIIPTPV